MNKHPLCVFKLLRCSETNTNQLAGLSPFFPLLCSLILTTVKQLLAKARESTKEILSDETWQYFFHPLVCNMDKFLVSVLQRP